MKNSTLKIFLRFAVFLLITIFCVLAVHVLRENTLQNAQKVGMVSTSNFAAEVHRNFMIMESQLKFGVALLEGEIGKGREHVEKIARPFMDQARKVLDSSMTPYIVGEDGRVIVSSGEQHPMTSLDMSKKAWYADTIARGGEICYTDVYREQATSRPVITIAKKFSHSNHVIAFDVYTDIYDLYFDRSMLRSGESFFFSDSSGGLLYACTPLTLNEEALKNYVRWIIKGIKAGKFDPYDSFLIDFDGRRRAVYYTRLDNGWYSIMTVPQSNIVRDVNLLYGILGIAILLFMSAIIFFSWRELRARGLMERSIATIGVLGNHYAAIYRINYEKNTYEMIKGTPYARARLEKNGSYDDLRNVVVGYFEPKGVELFLENFSVANMRKLVEQKVRNFVGDFQRMCDGVYRWTSVYLLFDDSLAPGEVVLCFRDIEDEKQKEQRERKLLQDSLEMSRQSEKSKQNFFSNVSHEMRTPLNAIIGMSELALKRLGQWEESRNDRSADGKNSDESMDKLRHCIEQIRFSGRQMKNLIDDILEISRMEQGKFSLNNEPLNLWQCLNDALAPYFLQATSEKKTFLFKMEKSRETVLGDPLRIAQVMNNLISNAFKFTDEGGTIRVEVERLPQEGVAKYRIAVSDNGAGMSKDFLPLVFTPYSRDTSFAARKTVGTGLGMPITRHLVEQMNGEISVQSEEGAGTTFTVVLPFALVQEDDAGQAVEESCSVESQKKDGFDLSVLSGMHVLVAEDNAINMELVTEVLTMQDMHVTQAWNGKEAVDLFAQSKPFHYAIILMDMRMPVMDGCEAARAIRELKREDASVPIVAVTANAFAEDILASTEAGMNGHVSKPLDFGQLLRLLAQLVGGK